MKKFLSSSVWGLAAGLGEPAAVGEAAVVVVVAGDIPGTLAVAPGIAGAAGVIPGAVTGAVVAPVTGAVAGDVSGAVAGVVTGAVTGLVAVVGGAPGGFWAGEVGGGVWPNEVSARATEKELAISSVFIGLIRKLSRPRIPMSWVSS